MNKGTEEGTAEEIKFVKELNCNKNSTFWNYFDIDDVSNVFAIHVINHVLNSLNHKTVKPKADIFLAKGLVPHYYIRNNDGYLSEDDLNKFSLVPMPFTGISVKRTDSKKYTIFKMTPPTFKLIFGSNVLGAGASLYCKRSEELSKNKSVLKGWGVTLDELKKEFAHVKNINLFDDSTSDLSIYQNIKNESNKKITNIIENDSKIANIIFCGKEIFPEPYSANYLYESGELKKAEVFPFTVTTGSGRSKGSYTIVIKPKGGGNSK